MQSLKLIQTRAYNNKIQSFNRHKAKQQAKRENTQDYAVSKLKQYVRPDTWCTSHCNCLRGSISQIGEKQAETPEYLRAKFELWRKGRELGAKVFSEVIFEYGLGTADLVFCWNNGEITIAEIVKSEEEASMLAKVNKYPFPTKFYRASNLEEIKIDSLQQVA